MAECATNAGLVLARAGATHAQQRYAIDNPRKFDSYSAHCWGITASEGPGPATLRVGNVEREFFDYVARGIPDGPDDGTLAPWAVAASLPFAPEIVFPTLDYCIHHAKLTEFNAYGFKASFNPSHPGASGNPYGWWVSPWHFGLNQGPIVLMIENHRSGLLWRLMRSCPVHRGRLAARGLHRRVACALKQLPRWYLIQPFSMGHFSCTGERHDRSE